MHTQTDWFNAVEVGDTGLIQQLLPQFKLSVNKAGDTALILAARLNKIGIVRILAPHEHGRLTKDGKTALMIAASRDYPDICELLAPYEASIYCDRGRDCLMIAAKSVSVESLTVLMKHISYRRDNQDLCALDYAVLAESLVCVRLLLQQMTFQEEVLELALSLARAKDLGAIETALKEALEHYHSLASSQINLKHTKGETKDGFKPAVSATNILTADTDLSQTSLAMTKTAAISKIPRPDGFLSTPGRQVADTMGPESLTPGRSLQQSMHRSYYFGASQPPKTGEPKASVDGFFLVKEPAGSTILQGTTKSFSPLASFVAPQIDEKNISRGYTPYEPYDFTTLSTISTHPTHASLGPSTLRPAANESLIDTAHTYSAFPTSSAAPAPTHPVHHDSSFNSFSEIERNLRLALSQIGTSKDGPSTPPSARTYQTVLDIVNSPAVKTTKQLISAMAPMVNLINHQSTNPAGRFAVMTSAEDLERGANGSSPLDAIESWKDVQKYITALEGHAYVKGKIASTPPSAKNILSSPLLEMNGSKVYEDRSILSALDAITSIKMSPASRLADRLGTPLRSIHFPDKEMDVTFKEILTDLPESKKDKITSFISRLYANVCTMESSSLRESQNESIKELEKLRNDCMLQKFEIGSQATIIEALTTELEQLRQQTKGSVSAGIDGGLMASRTGTAQTVGTQTDLEQEWFAAIKRNDLAYVKAHVGVMARTRDADQKTALMHAASNGYIDLALVLSEHEAGIQQPDGFTALMHAVLSESYLIVKLLLDKEAYYSTTQLSSMPAGCTALMLAAQRGNVQAINVLLERLCTERDSLGNTALHYAVTGGSVAALTALLSKSIQFELHDIDAALNLAQENTKEGLTNILQPLRKNKEASIQKYIKECSELRQRIMELEGMHPIAGAYHGDIVPRQYGSSRSTSGSFSGPSMSMPLRIPHGMPNGSMSEPGKMHEAPQRITEDDGFAALHNAMENKYNGSLASMQADDSLTLGTPSLFTPGFNTRHNGVISDDHPVYTANVQSANKDHITLEPNPMPMQATTYEGSKHLSSASALLQNHTKGTDRRVSIINTTISPMTGHGAVSEIVSPTINMAIAKTTMQKHHDENDLFRALASRDLAAVKTHIERFARKQDKQGLSPLMYAIRSGFTDAAVLLKDASAGMTDFDGKTALMYCAEHGLLDVARAIAGTESGMQTRNIPQYPLYTALMFAVTHRNADIVKLLAPLESGKQNGNGETALMLATKMGYNEAVQILIYTEAGIMTKDGCVALALALESGNMQAAELLATREAPVISKLPPHDGKSCTDLMQAVELNDIVQVYALIGQQAKLSDRNGRTGLMLAAERGHNGIVRLLMPYEAKMQMTGRGWNNGTTALMLAASKGNLEACRMLLPVEAKMQNKEGRTALIFAAWNGHADCVRLLKEAEARMCTSSAYELGEGFTALMAAATNGHEDCVHLLMDAELSLTQPDKKGALYWANDNRIRELLKAAT